MKHLFIIGLFTVSVAICGCGGTRETNTANGNASIAATPKVTATPAVAVSPPTAERAVKDGWWVRVCTSKTQASGVDLEIGLGGNSGSHRYWRKWHSNDPPEFDVPGDVRQVSEIWIKGSADPRDRNVHMCTYYRGDSTQKMTFDNNEEHETSQGDRDDCDC